MPSTQARQQLVKTTKTLVVKMGTNVLADDKGHVDAGRVRRLAGQIARLHKQGLRVTVVSSGAIGAGVGLLGLARRPRELAMLQATASVGQPVLMRLFEEGFRRNGLHAAQMLLTRSDFEHRARYLNIRRTIAALHELSAVPIINENDTVAVEEIRYGDNDIIAALTANLLRADLLVILSVVEGLIGTDGKRIDLVHRIDKDVTGLVQSTRSSLGSGGMASKLQAIRRVTEAGDYAVIAGGRVPNVLTRLLSGEKVGTLFIPAPNKLNARKRWIGWTVLPRGTLTVDDGAARAMRRGGKSLLAIGVTGVEGQFGRGDVVRIRDSAGQEFARGLSNYTSGEVGKIKGLRSGQFAAILGGKPSDEVVHRDNLVITASGQPGASEGSMKPV
jgi:glutamate 5-kinase